MKRNWLILSLVALLLVAMTGSALAWSPRLEGKPDQFRPGGAKGYYIWQDHSGFHIWTTTRGMEHKFSGVIKTDGEFVHVRGQRLEGDDRFRETSDEQDNHWFTSQGRFGKFRFQGREVDHDTDKISFRFETAGGSDGLNFRVRDGSWITFELYMDGRRVDNDNIYIGDNGWHPRRSTFTIRQ